MGRIIGFAAYDFRGNLVQTAGSLPATVAKINKKIVVDATAKILCADGTVIMFISGAHFRYFTATDDPSLHSKCLSMLQEMALAPIDRVGSVYTSYISDPVIFRDIPDAAIITLNEENIIGLSSSAQQADESSSLLSADGENGDLSSFAKKERARCKRLASYILLASIVATIMGLAASSLIFVIVTDRPF
jgi:hypothetical protein